MGCGNECSSKNGLLALESRVGHHQRSCLLKVFPFHNILGQPIAPAPIPAYVEGAFSTETIVHFSPHKDPAGPTQKPKHLQDFGALSF